MLALAFAALLLLAAPSRATEVRILGFCEVVPSSAPGGFGRLEITRPDGAVIAATYEILESASSAQRIPEVVVDGFFPGLEELQAIDDEFGFPREAVWVRRIEPSLQSLASGGFSRANSSVRKALTTSSNFSSNLELSDSQPVKSAARRDFTCDALPLFQPENK